MRDVEPEVLEDLRRDAQLSAAAVHHDERRRIREPPPLALGRRVLLLQQPREPTGEHLLHAGEIVLSGDALDLEPAVVGALGQAVLEDHHRSDRVGGPEVGDVVALDPEGRLLEAELLGELRERAGAGAEVGCPPQLVPMERLRRVAGHDLHQPSLRAAGRHRDRDVGAAPVRQPGLEHLAVRRLGRHEDPRRHLLALHVELAEERRDELRPVEVLDAVDDPALATQHPSASDREHLEGGLQVVLGEADDVEALRLDEDHLLALERPARSLELVAEPRRLLVLLPAGGVGHLLAPAASGPASSSRRGSPPARPRRAGRPPP